jgi:hypothetical protein
MNFMEQWLRPCTREERVRAKKKKKKKKKEKKEEERPWRRSSPNREENKG